MRSLSLYNKIFFIFIVAILVSISIIGWFGFKSTSDAYKNLAYDTSLQNAESLEVAIENKLHHVPKDVLFTTDFYALRKFLVWRSIGEYSKAKEWKQVYSNTLLDFLTTKESYYQARIIDLDGNEIINAQYLNKQKKTLLVKDSLLQNKKGRDYVEKTKLLKKGEIYISSMNLNVEHGVIEKPFVPVIRYSTPIVGVNGKVVAIFVINEYAQAILDIMKKQSELGKVKGIHYYLIDKESNYLYNEEKSKRWNKQLKHGATFNKEHFKISKYFANKEEGTFSKNNKIYSFRKVYPLVMNHEKYWYVVASVDETVALAKLDEFKSLFIIVVLLITLVSFFLVRLLILRITNPLTRVTAQLTALSEGKIQKEEISYKANDEVGKIVQSTQKVIFAIDRIIKQANLVARGDLSKEIQLLSDEDQLGLAINSMTARLKEIEVIATNLSQGNYETAIIAQGVDDKLGIALTEMINYLDTVTQVAESVSKGKIDLHYKAVGHEDRLGIAVLKMISYLKTILHQADAISQEDFSQTIKPKSKSDELGTAMEKMTTILSNSYIKNKEEIYFSEGIGDFTDKLIGIDSVEELATEAIAVVSRYVGASAGVVYLFDAKTSMLNVRASFAFSSGKNTAPRFALGEGVVGQVAVDKTHILLTNIEQDKYQIHSGTTQGSSKEVFVFPLIHEGSLFGVAEVMSFTSFSKVNIDYLLKAAGIFATTMHLTQQNTQIKTLLEKSQAAFEELQTQSEELQETNVQMEEQQQQLTVQSTELREKNETLGLAKEEIDRRAEELEKASKYKSEFLANMSHELRTPLNSIILLSKLLGSNQEKNLNEKDVEKVNVINKSGNDLLFLINDILDLTKIESGNMQLNETKVYSGDILDNMKGLFSALAMEKKIDFVLEDDFKEYFLTDSSKLSQVLKNLLSNALKFTHKGRVSVSLRSSDSMLEIIVHDTGIGIPQNKLGTIFEAFKQVDGSISREFGGTGLGLSISKTIVDLMDGSIVVESELGKGTSFIVSLPLKQDKTVEIPSVIGQKYYEDKIVVDALNGKNILIVDDDSRNIFTLTSTLEPSGVEVYSAFNGEEAIELLDTQDEKIDLILMDIMMPVMDGLIAIQKIKKSEQHRNIPIIAVTSKTTAKDKQECLDAGADEYLAKPIETNALFAMIKAWTS